MVRLESWGSNSDLIAVLERDDGGVDDLYRAIGVAEGCMISTKLQLGPLLSLHPLDGGILREAERLLVNDVFQQAMIPTQFTAERWHMNAMTNMPVVIVVIHQFPASSQAEADLGARKTIAQLLDILALHRDATVRLIATAVARLDGATEPALWSDYASYGGNLLGGFISGEDAQALLSDLSATVRDPVLSLWLGMSKEATGEPNPEFAVARWWNLIEAMATARQRRGDLALDFEGRPLLDHKGAPVTTDRTRPRVHEYLRRAFEKHGVVETSWTLSADGCPGTATLRRTLDGWIGLRNAVAHYGRLDSGCTEQQTQPWFKDAIAARALDLAKGVHYQRYRIGELARLVLRWEIAALE